MKTAQLHHVRLTLRGRRRRTIATLRSDGDLSASHAMEVLEPFTARVPG